MSEYVIAVVGCRDYTNYFKVDLWLDQTRPPSDIVDRRRIRYISGGATGVDLIAKMYSEANGYPFTEYPADWDTHGKAAGPIRNKQMAEACNECIAFWDGKSRGTQNMIATCATLGKKVTVIPI